MPITGGQQLGVIATTPAWALIGVIITALGCHIHSLGHFTNLIGKCVLTYHRAMCVVYHNDVMVLSCGMCFVGPVE